ncbi:MAG: hypothetical protein WC761_04840 [Candidatus Paceibacterota bacterium]|jgi:hypothetical protein
MQQNFKDWVIQNQFLTLKGTAREMFLMVLRDEPTKVRDRIVENLEEWGGKASIELGSQITIMVGGPSKAADKLLADLEERFKDELAALPWAA